MRPIKFSIHFLKFGSLFFCFLNILNIANAQEEKTAGKVKRSDYRNVVKLNITSPILYNSALLLGYERVLKNNQTINISGGYIEFPVSLSLPDFLKLHEQKNSSGYNIEVDYRFYLSRENKYPAPHGIYLAPFMAIHHFQSGRDLTYTDTAGTIKDVQMTNKINFFSIGGQLGYQFVIKRRFVIDAVLFGPGLTKYKFNVGLDGNLNSIDKETITGKILEALRDKLPLLDEIASGNEVSKSGIQSFWSVGFRYSISIGFRF